MGGDEVCLISVIDIGTNTILMLTVEPRGGSIVVVDDHHEVARLGRGIDATRTIMPEAFDRMQVFLERYRRIAEELGSERIVAFGTSALRDAENSDEFIAVMHERTGIEIEVLSGDDEARWTYVGALFGLDLDSRRVAVLDIGGGSTELAFGDQSAVWQALSADIGAVRITERFLSELPPSPADLEAAIEYADELTATFFDVPSETTLVGVAGTVTTLAAIAQNRERFDADELNGTVLTYEQIESIASKLSLMTESQMADVPQIAAGRADIILGGALILRAAMMRLDANEIVVSTRGVRYGIALRDAES